MVVAVKKVKEATAAFALNEKLAEKQAVIITFSDYCTKNYTLTVKRNTVKLTMIIDKRVKMATVNVAAI